MVSKHVEFSSNQKKKTILDVNTSMRVIRKSLVTKLCKVRKSCMTATMVTHFVLKFAFVNAVDTPLPWEHIY
jgi:hypothetical protein